MTRWLSALVAFVALSSAAPHANASYAVYVGRNLTRDGSVLLGGTGEEVSGHWLVRVPGADHAPGATVTVGVTEAANIPGELIEIPQVSRTFRFFSMDYSDFVGFPPPLTNGGMNEHHVAVRDVWSPSRDELVRETATPQRGPSYSDLARLMLARAETARDAVTLVGELIAEHGYATYGGNSHLIADEREGWVVIELAGGHGLWAAERLGPDDVRVSYPGYIGEMPSDFLASPDFDGAPNLIDFAVERGWYDPAAGAPFDFHKVYGAQGRPMRSPGVKFVDPGTLEAELRGKAPDITVADLRAFVRDYRISDDEAGYGQVAHLRQDVPRDLGRLWIAPTGSVTAPFVPYFMGVESVPPEYGIHRYLMKDAGRRFLSPDFAAQEATEFAARTFKRLMYYVCEHPDRFLPEVTEALTAFERRASVEADVAEARALALLDAGEPELAGGTLTDFTHRKAHEALDLGRELLGSIEARSRLLYGARQAEGAALFAETGSDRRTVNCRDTMADPQAGPSGPESTLELSVLQAARNEPQDEPVDPGEEFPVGMLALAAALGVAVGVAVGRRRR